MRHRARRALERQLAYQRAKARLLPDDQTELDRALEEYALWVRSRIERYCRIAPGARVLEVGSGAHGIIFFMGIPGAVGVDPLAVEYARLFPRWQSRARTIAACGESLPFGDASFDVAISDNVVDHADDPKRIVEELARVLAPGGALYFTVNVHHRVYDIASRVHGLMQSVGSRWEIPAFADHTVHLTPRGAELLFDGVPLRIVHRETAREEAWRGPRHVGDLVKRLFFKNARFELIATRG